ncbi:MAG: hypothetical protein ACLFQK_11695 [Fibrobacterota bacterium]
MRTKTIFTLLTVLALSAFAGSGKKERGDMRQNMQEKLKTEIGLSEDQFKSLEAVRLETMRKAEENRHEIKMEKIRLRELHVQNSVKRGEIKEIIANIKSAQEEMHDARYEGINKVLDIFTDQQINKLAESGMLGRMIDLKEKEKGGRRDHHRGPEGRKGHRKPGKRD